MSRTSKSNLRDPPSEPLTQTLIPFRAVPPQNKADKEAGPSLSRLKGHISSFENLSTVTLIRRLEHRRKRWYNASRVGMLDDLWKTATDLAISQLGGSVASGPKTVKVVKIVDRDEYGPDLVIDEVLV